MMDTRFWLFEIPKTQTSYSENSQYKIKKLDQRCQEIYLDILDYNAIADVVKNEQPNAIFHLAAIGDVTEAFHRPKLTYEVSSNGTLNLLEALKQTSPHTLFVSHTTDKVYSGNSVPFNEQMWFNPSHIYEAGKVSQEYLTRIYAKSYGLKAITIRCGNYFGGYDFNFNRVVPYAIKCALTQKPILLRSNGLFTRDFLYIKDAVLVNQLVLNSWLNGGLDDYFGEAFNFSLELQLSVKEMVIRIKELCGTDVDVNVLDSAENEIPDMRLDCTSAKSSFNWRKLLTRQWLRRDN